MITIKDKQYKKVDIKKLYPAAIVKTGYEDETTQISLEWLDTECNGAVEVVEYGIYINLKDGKQDSFLFKSRDEFDSEIEKLANQLQG